ncbi:hypothetical protein [Halomicrococcus sp. SG-WS-1]|uniref:hypothetical protein n=1 Tax=Halomicrococcus sp. SG-WS-1 TaxID=3439057 RepID=UPI003F7A40EC
MPPDSDRKPWKEITPHRKRVASAVAFFIGLGEFTRNELESAVEQSKNVGTYVENVGALEKSLQYTRLLNSLVDDGYLEKIEQGGQIFLVIDYGKEEPEAVPAGDTNGLRKLAKNALKRNDCSLNILQDIDFTKTNQVKDKVNEAIGRQDLATHSNPSIYKMYKTAHAQVVDDRLPNLPTQTLEGHLFYPRQEIEPDTQNHTIEATIEKMEEDVVRISVYKDSKVVNEIQLKTENIKPIEELSINDTYDVVVNKDETILLIKNPSRTEEIQATVKETIEWFEEHSQLASKGGEDRD